MLHECTQSGSFRGSSFSSIGSFTKGKTYKASIENSKMIAIISNTGDHVYFSNSREEPDRPYYGDWFVRSAW